MVTDVQEASPAHAAAPAAPAADGKPVSDMAGLTKAAILFVTLGEETAATILKHLPEEDAELITKEIADLGMVEKEQIETVVGEFRDLATVCQYVKEGGIDYATRLIEKSFPQVKAYRLIRLLETQKQNIPFAFLKNTETESLLTFLGEEHPQTIALVLSYMEPAKAAEILTRLPPEKQFDIVKRIAALEHTSPEAIRHVESGLRRYLASLAFEEFQEVGGIKTVAELLNVLDRATSKSILENLEEEKPELSDEIKKLMFVFEDILLVDDRGIQNLLKDVENKQLALALKTASPELKDKIFRNMSKRAAELVGEEMAYLGPVRVADVEAAQQAVVDIVRRLEEQSLAIISGRGGEGEIVV
jgi:flagellar motor switch protein FliG